MKPWAAALLACIAGATPALAQQYEITWRTVDGGGATGLTGGPYRLDGTIGQPDAGTPMVGNPYELAGGFWPVGLPSVPTADLSVSISDAPDPVTGLQPLTYTLAVANGGPAAATNVTVTDSLPAGVVFQSAGGGGWTCGESSGTVTCTRPSLIVGAAPSIVITVTTPPTAQTLVSTASIAGAEADPLSANNTDTETTTVNAAPAADLSIVKSDGGVTVTWGAALTYTILVRNNGPAAVSGAVVADTFPAGLTAVTWTCTATSGSSCQGAGTGNINQSVSLLAGGTATFTAVATVIPGTYDLLVNTATLGVPAGVFDPVLANNTSTETTPVLPPDVIFDDGFNSGSLGSWSGTSGAGLSVLRGAAFQGGYALQLMLRDATPQFVQDDSPFAEPRYRARFYLTMMRLQMAEGDEFDLLNGYTAAGAARIKLQVVARNSQKLLRAVVVLDDGSVVQTPLGSEVPLTFGWRWVEIDWQASSAPGANDGRLDLWVDGQPQAPLTGLDTDEARIATVRWGAVAGLDAGTTGAFRLDEFASRRRSPVGPFEAPR